MSNEQESKPVMKREPWKPEPWVARSEEFYSDYYKTGKCPSCGKEIMGPMSICDCAGMRKARYAFKQRIYAEAGVVPVPEKVVDNPNRNIEPNEREELF